MNVEKFKVDLTIKSMTVGHEGHCDHVVLFAGNSNFAGAAINLLDIELFALVQSDVGEYFHNLLGDHVSCTKRGGDNVGLSKQTVTYRCIRLGLVFHLLFLSSL